MKRRPSMRAKYASETAVDPLEASTIVVSGPIRPLHKPYRNNDRARRCFRLPDGWVDSSLRYSAMPGSTGSGTRKRCVSEERLKSASMIWMAAATQERSREVFMEQPCCDGRLSCLPRLFDSLAANPAALRRGAHAVLLLDRAGWHTTGRVVVPKNITLVFLPSRAPELNPVENIWQYLRQNWLSNRVFETYEAIIEAACDALA